MDFYEVIRTRRSVRKFRADAIPEDVLQRVLDAARIAQSGSNRQPWRYIIIKDKERMKEIPEDVQVVALTPLGYPADAGAFSENTNRKDLKEIVCYEKYE